MNTQTFKIEGDRSVKITRFTGEVIDSRAWSETEVSSSTRPNYDPNSHQIITEIHSNTTNNLEFWLRNVEGDEKVFNFEDSGLKLRKGHIVTIVWCALEGKKSVGRVYVYQHTTGATIDYLEDLQSLGKRAMKIGIVEEKSSLIKLLAILMLISIVLIPVFLIWGIADSNSIKAKFFDFRAKVYSALENFSSCIDADIKQLKARRYQEQA